MAKEDSAEQAKFLSCHVAVAKTTGLVKVDSSSSSTNEQMRECFLAIAFESEFRPGLGSLLKAKLVCIF